VNSLAHEFIRAHTELAPPPLVPEVQLHLATEITPLWLATQDWLDSHAVPPPYWAFAWAGGQALARYVLDRPQLVRGRSVLDLGAGGGIVAIAAARCGATRVVAADTDVLAHAALDLNACANRVELEIEGADLVSGSVPLDRNDVLLAGDVFYEESFSVRLHLWLTAVARSGVRVLVGDPGRAYVPHGLELCAEYEVAVPEDLESAVTKRTSVWSYATLG